MVRAGALDGYVASALVHAVAARVAVHQGDLAGAQQQLARATRLRPLLTYALPYFAVQTLLELGRVCLALDDATGARVVLRQATSSSAAARPRHPPWPGRGCGPSSTPAAAGPWGSPSLTTAELRLLPLLSTHLTFARSASGCTSRRTVKTQAMSIYRKLGASSRSQAVQRAQQLGLGG